MLSFTITLPERGNYSTVKNLLEEQWLVPRKIRHFLRIKNHLLVNGQVIHWQSPVKAGDSISLTFDDEDYPDKKIPFGQSELVDCLYEDEHLIIVNKSEGMKTHGNEPNEIALLNHVSAFVGKTCYVVHRLDMETSGAIIFAKNPFILPILNRLLEEKQIKRQYWALVEGAFSKKQATYQDPIGRDRYDRRKRTVSPQGQKAVTHITRLKTFSKGTLVNCQLDTGRTHQIRVHLSHHGHTIVGDPLYNPNASTNRLMLHAHTLSFTHPFTGEDIKIKALSESFEAVIKSFNK